MRRHFETWGLELTDDEFAQAFAALGVIHETVPGRWPATPYQIQRRLLYAWEAVLDPNGLARPLPWTPPPPPEWLSQRELPLPPLSPFAEAWRTLLTKSPARTSPRTFLRLAIYHRQWRPQWPGAHWPDALDWLARPSVGCSSVFRSIQEPRPAREPAPWPLRAGILPGPGTALLHAALARRASLPISNFTVELLTPERARCGLLVLPQGLREAVGEILAASVRPDTDAVLVLGPVEETGSRAETLIQTLLELCNGRAVILTRANTRTATAETAAEYVFELILALSHNQSLDAAAFTASKVLGLSPPYLHGDPEFLEKMRVSSLFEELGKRIKRSVIVTEERTLGLESLSPASASFHDLQKELDGIAPGLDWMPETAAARYLADLGTRTRNVSAQAAQEAPSRFLRARVSEPLSEGGARLVKTLKPARSYRAQVSIGPHAPGHLALDTPFPTLEEPPEEEGHLLQVVFFDPHLMGEPQSGEILLPPTGESSFCDFYFYMREGVAALEARITVLHRNRVLQTGVLRGKAGGQSALTLQLDAVPRKRLQVLSARSYFDGAIVVNDTDAGEHVVTATTDGVVARIKLNDAALGDLTKVLEAQLSEIARTPEDYRTLRDKGNEALLRDLARRGARFHEVLTKHSIIGPRFHGQGPVQVVTARFGGFLPIELAYRFPCPDKDAPLCAHSEEGLTAGACPGACKDGGTKQRVCPLGFWSLSRVIERHEHRPEHVELEPDYELRSEPLDARAQLARPSAAVLAASPLASEVDPNAITDLHHALDELFSGKVYEAHSWREWVATLNQHKHPMLLVLLPHHAQKPVAIELLELATDDTLESIDVGPEHVVGEPPTAPPYPVVLLLGCKTQLARVAFDSFAAVFRERGAAIVVSTIATVLGRDAAPTAKELTRELVKRMPGESTFGEVLLRVRRTLLAQGKVMALSLTAYGDADWKLTDT